MNDSTKFLMMMTAILIDVLQGIITFIPIAGQIINSLITPCAGFMFWLWFKLHGIPFNKKRTSWLMGGFIIELIPLLNVLPTWTLAVGRMIASTKIQEIISKKTPESA